MNPFFVFSVLETFFQILGITILVIAGVIALVQFIQLQPWLLRTDQARHSERVRLVFGQRIVFGLEFFIVADAIATLADPSLSELYSLGLIVLIRTVLSFFISRELIIFHAKEK